MPDPLPENNSVASDSSDFAARITGAVLSVVREESFTGPLPPHQHLAAYESILPGAADRIIAMAEKEQLFRQKSEGRSLNLEFSYAVLGYILGFAIAISLIYGAWSCARSGNNTGAALFLAASAIGMVTSFIRGRTPPSQKPPRP